MLTNEQINEIEAMCDAAEEGPWMIEGRYIESDNRAVVKAVIGATEADMQFVSQARTLLPQFAADYRKAMEVVKLAREDTSCPHSEKMHSDPYPCFDCSSQKLCKALAGLEG